MARHAAQSGAGSASRKHVAKIRRAGDQAAQECGDRPESEHANRGMRPSRQSMIEPRSNVIAEHQAVTKQQS